jgi:hypothetical protein
MTIAASPPRAQSEALPPAAPTASPAPDGWREIRSDPDIQFGEITMAPEVPREPGWFDALLEAIVELLAMVIGPVGQLIGANWQVLQWVLVALVALFVVYLALRLIGPFAARRRATASAASSEAEWQPSRAETLALLEDADRLAAEGRFDEATHLLLKRSVSQIASAQPDWVDPSSTARELAALPGLPDAARRAFATIAERVERSLFALRRLERADWEAARSAYADFAGIAIERQRSLAP